jgi:hypothetical protein
VDYCQEVAHRVIQELTLDELIARPPGGRNHEMVNYDDLGKRRSHPACRQIECINLTGIFNSNFTPLGIPLPQSISALFHFAQVISSIFKFFLPRTLHRHLLRFRNLNLARPCLFTFSIRWRKHFHLHRTRLLPCRVSLSD